MKQALLLAVCCWLLLVGCQAAPRKTAARDRDATQKALAERQALAAGQQAAPIGLPNSVDQHVKLGRSEISAWSADHQSSRLAAARMHFEAALVQNPSHARAHHGLAIVADLEEKFDEAERHYHLALAQSPNDSDILGDLGYSYLLQDRFAEGERYSQMAVQVNPSNENALKHLGDAYARQGKTKQAQETYAKVLSPEETRKALAENAPSGKQIELASHTEESLLDKLIPGKSQGQKLSEDIQRRYSELESQRRQGQPTSGVAANGPAPMPSHDRLAQGELLKRQLAAIEAERYQQAQGGPIVIDEAGQATRMSGTNAWSTQPTGVTPAGSYSTPPLIQPAGPMRGNSPNGAVPTAPWGTPQGPPIDPQGAGSGITIQPASYGTPNPQSPPWPQPSGNPVRKTWSGIEPPQHLAATNPVGAADQRNLAPYGTPSGANSASFPNGGQPGAALRDSSTPSSYGMPVSAPPSAPPLVQPAFRQNGQFPPQSNSGSSDRFVEASNAAARMGMGLGPGTMFPVFSSATPVSPPGSSSMINGNAFPQAHRVLPTDQPPLDLNQAYRPEPATVTPPAYSQGGQMPPTTMPMYSQQQFGTASRFDSPTLQNSGVPQSQWTDPNLQQYEAQRWEAGRQFNNAAQQVWAQGPVNSPVSPAAGSVYSYPQGASGPMYTPNPPTGPAPAEWSHQQPIQQVPGNELTQTPSEFQSYANPTTRPPGPPQDNNGLVIPPAYRPNVRPTTSTPWPNSPPLGSGPAEYQGLPTIRPNAK